MTCRLLNHGCESLQVDIKMVDHGVRYPEPGISNWPSVCGTDRIVQCRGAGIATFFVHGLLTGPGSAAAERAARTLQDVQTALDRPGGAERNPSPP